MEQKCGKPHLLLGAAGGGRLFASVRKLAARSLTTSMPLMGLPPPLTPNPPAACPLNGPAAPTDGATSMVISGPPICIPHVGCAPLANFGGRMGFAATVADAVAAPGQLWGSWWVWGWARGGACTPVWPGRTPVGATPQTAGHRCPGKPGWGCELGGGRTCQVDRSLAQSLESEKFMLEVSLAVSPAVQMVVRTLVFQLLVCVYVGGMCESYAASNSLPTPGS